MAKSSKQPKQPKPTEQTEEQSNLKALVKYRVIATDGSFDGYREVWASSPGEAQRMVAEQN